jgi:uncharacterized lipoprotein YddW (UPF0748 family)
VRTTRLYSVSVGCLLLSLIGSAALGATPQFKVRALWVDESGLSSAAAMDRLIAKCQRAGINMILPDVMCYGTVFFKSPHFQGRVAADEAFDPLAVLTRKAHAAGLQCHAWCCVYYEGGSKPIRKEWLNQSLDGKPSEQIFLSAGNPEVNRYLLPVLTDLLAYDIDGIHLDYIRYPGTVYDYSEPTRKAFQAVAGFDPMDFVDHPERIVPAQAEPYPIRVLHPKVHIERVWEAVEVERTLDAAGVGFALVSESPENIDALRAPGLLILSCYYDVPPAMLQALRRYAERGGDILWADAPISSLKKSPILQQLSGLEGGRYLPPRRLSLQAVGEHALARLIPTNSFTSYANNAPKVTTATLIARLDSGEPAVTINAVGKGKVMVMGFGVMSSKAACTGLLIKRTVDWFRTSAGFAGADPLGDKRAQWISWRGEQVTRLVRGISQTAKAKSAKLAVSSSGGPSAWEYYACYRDARRWLTEEINDFVCPMNYTENPAELAAILEDQRAATPAGKSNRVYPGLQLYRVTTVDGRRTTKPLDAAIVEQQLRMVQQMGHEGFCLFAYRHLTDDTIRVVSEFSR